MLIFCNLLLRPRSQKYRLTCKQAYWQQPFLILSGRVAGMIWEWFKRKSTGDLRVVFIVYCGDREQQRAINIKLKLKLKFLMPLPTRVWCSRDINQATKQHVYASIDDFTTKKLFNCQKINAWYTEDWPWTLHAQLYHCLLLLIEAVSD